MGRSEAGDGRQMAGRGVLMSTSSTSSLEAFCVARACSEMRTGNKRPLLATSVNSSQMVCPTFFRFERGE